VTEKKLHPLVEYELGFLGDDDPAEVMAATPQKLRVLIAGVDDESVRRRPAADSWSAIELLGHFADIELIHGERFRRILAEDKPRLVPFDPDGWNATLGNDKRSPADHLALFEAIRRANLDLWRRASPEKRGREYIHGERGVESYELLFKMCAGHDRLHMAQIQEALRPRASASR
jgi:DinB family protein